jgi:hypothetical protein
VNATELTYWHFFQAGASGQGFSDSLIAAETRTEEGEMPALFEVDDGPEPEEEVESQQQRSTHRKGKFGKLGKAGGKLKRGIRSAKQKVAGKLGSGHSKGDSSSQHASQSNTDRSRSRSGSNGPSEPSSPKIDEPAQMSAENFDTLIAKISEGEQELQDAIRLQVRKCRKCYLFRVRSSFGGFSGVFAGFWEGDRAGMQTNSGALGVRGRPSRA